MEKDEIFAFKDFGEILDKTQKRRHAQNENTGLNPSSSRSSLAITFYCKNGKKITLVDMVGHETSNLTSSTNDINL